MLKPFLFIACLAVGACKSKSDAPVAADNTARNQFVTPTADQSAKSGDDFELTRQIRRAVVADGSLSTTAHNCKIVVTGGTVTLEGPVKSSEEREKVATIAEEIAGQERVVNDLEIVD
jgi:osmotically-inducible protein OsmY